MTQREYLNTVTAIMKIAITSLKENKYDELLSAISLDETWESVDDFIEVLDENIVNSGYDSIDEFSEDNIQFELDIDEDIEDEETVDEDFLIDMRVIEYRPTSEDDELDFWFEFIFNFGDDGKLYSVLNINV